MAHVVVVATATAGFSSLAEPAAAAPLIGGCWSYLPPVPPTPPAPTVPLTPEPEPPARADLSEIPLDDRSIALEPWSPATPAAFALTTSGPTRVGGERAVTLTIPEGPVVSPILDASVEATFHLAVNDVDIEPITTKFDVVAGEPIVDLEVTGFFPILTAGAQDVVLRAAFFDVSGLDPLRVACNGQSVGELTVDPADPTGAPGTNPATTQIDTDVTTSFTSVATSGGALTSVTGQQVASAARPGDTLVFETTGFVSVGQGTARLCTADNTCTAPGTFLTDAEGVGNGQYVVPDSVPVGIVSLRLGDGDRVVELPVVVLGPPVMGGQERSGTRRSIVTLTGTGWDPVREVRIEGLVGVEGSSPAGADAHVMANPAGDGSFQTRFVVSDREVRSLRATQQRTNGATLVAQVTVEGPLPGGGGGDENEGRDDESEGGDTETPAAPGGTTTVPPAATTPLVIPPLAIPQPLPLPFDTVDQPVLPVPGPETPEVTPSDLVVSDVRLEGSLSFGELFGGTPERTLMFEVENQGAVTVTDPVVAIALGRSTDVEPGPVAATVPALEPGESVTVGVPVALPAASFGTYHVVGRVGETDAGAFTLRWVTYPYGLFLLNLIGAGLLAVGLRRRLRTRPSPRLLPAPVLAAREVPAMNSDAVVDLARLESWWEIKDKGVRPSAKPLLPALAGALPGVARPGGRPAGPTEDAVVDLDAADLWWRRQIDASGAGSEDAIVDLDAAEKWWSQSREGASINA